MLHSSNRSSAAQVCLCVAALLVSPLFFALTAKAQNTITTVAGGGTNSSVAINAVVSYPTSVAVDSHGNVFVVAKSMNQVYKLDLQGNFTLVAGNGSANYSGDNGAATSASLNAPSSVAVDASGNLFIADSGNSRVRRVDASTGIITTVAGNGTWGYSGDGGPATSAELSGPSGVAVDSSGNLFIADLGNSRIRRVDAASHVITTVAGNGTIGSSGDGGPARSAELSGPSGVAVDSSGNLFIADSGANRIRRVDAATGIITTVAGQASWGFSGDGGPATSASLNYPYGVAVDGAGDLLIADTENSRIRQVALVPLVSFSSTNLSFQSQAVGTSSAPQTVTVTNAGGANLTITSIAASSNFGQTNNCPAAPATLNPGSTCTVNVTFTPSTGGSITGTIAVTDNAFDSPEVIALSGTGSDFTLASASGSSTSATVSPGATATYTLAVEGTGGFNQSVSFTCTGAPSESTCTVSPSPVTVGSPATNLKVTVTTTAPSASRPRSRRHPPAPPLLPVQGKVALLALLLAGWAWAIRGWRQLAGSRGRAAIVSMAAGLLLSLVMAACGGGGGSSSTPTVPGTPAGTYTLTVTGTAGSGSTALSHSATLTLTVS